MTEYYQIGISFKRYKIREVCPTKNSINRSLEFTKNFKEYYSLEDFKKDLKYDDMGYVNDFYYYNVKIRRIYERIYVLSLSKLVHYSTVYAQTPYRNIMGKWTTGWKGNAYGMSHKYKLDIIEGIIPLNSMLEKIKEKYINCTVVNRRVKCEWR
jgi:hypothetical protein